MNIERRGVNAAWLKGHKKYRKNVEDWIESFSASTWRELEYYVAHGVAIDANPATTPNFTPPRKNWEIISTSFSFYAVEGIYRVELALWDGMIFNAVLAVRAFVAAYTMDMIGFYSISRSLERNRGKSLGIAITDNTYFIALGMLIGCQKESFAWVRAMIAAKRKQYYPLGVYSVQMFIIGAIADYMGESEAFREDFGIILDSPELQGLLGCWRSSDLELLAPWCLAALDFHTHSCSAKESDRGEFVSGSFSRIPIEILLVFKLRQLLGLPNPELDHPLMKLSFGLPDSETIFDTIAQGEDTLIHRARQRMMQDGYDEAQIFREMMA